MEGEGGNFVLDKYFETVSRSVHDSIDEIMTKLQPQLYQHLKSRNVNNVKEEDLSEGCSQLIERIKQQFEANMDKFQMYSLRNIFNSPSSSLDIVNSSSVGSSSTALDSEEQELDRTLQRLRSIYLKLQKDYLQLSTECRDMDTLLKEMRSAMFNLRVALQSLDDFEISPLSETTYMVSQYQLKLQQCIQNGQDLLQTIKQYEDNQHATTNSEEEMDAIKMDSTETLQQLTKGFQG